MQFDSVSRFRFDSSESCCICLKLIGAGKYYVRAGAKIAHYRCALDKGWKRQSRSKKKLAREVKIQRIKVVRNGEIVKVIG